MNTTILIIAFMLIDFYGFSQIEVTGQYKTRTEFANGYKQPLLSAEDPGLFISQRARCWSSLKSSSLEQLIKQICSRH